MSSPPSRSRRQFIKYGIAGAVGFGVATAIELPVLNNVLQNQNQVIANNNEQITQLQNQAQLNTDLLNQVTAGEALGVLSINEVNELKAIVSTIIPNDSNGPGGVEAGVISFIDHELFGDYGNNARMYMKGPFVLSGQTNSLIVDGITYSQGTIATPFSGPTYQYNLTLREFWRTGLTAIQSYSNSAYGNNFEKLNSGQQTQVLTDLYNNKPTNFNGIVPLDFFNELIFLVWSGYLMDPMYGGNQLMAGWKLVAFNGTNMGDAYGEGFDVRQLMVDTKATRLQPATLGQYQKGLGLIGGN